jgi:hypothetical protein
MKAFTDSRRILWLGGVALLVVGLLVAFLILPATEPVPAASPTNIQVPKMKNVPPAEAPKMQLQVNKQAP